LGHFAEFLLVLFKEDSATISKSQVTSDTYNDLFESEYRDLDYFAPFR
jgi:hypothetical protein